MWSVSYHSICNERKTGDWFFPELLVKNRLRYGAKAVMFVNLLSRSKNCRRCDGAVKRNEVLNSYCGILGYDMYCSMVGVIARKTTNMDLWSRKNLTYVLYLLYRHSLKYWNSERMSTSISSVIWTWLHVTYQHRERNLNKQNTLVPNYEITWRHISEDNNLLINPFHAHVVPYNCQLLQTLLNITLQKSIKTPKSDL
jgi:hypothetical protein